MRNVLKRLRAALGNAVVWGLGWFGASAATFSFLHLTGLLTDFTWSAVLESATNFGIIGFVAGAAFAGFIRLAYHGRELLEVSRVRFALGGTMLPALLVPALIVVGRLLTSVAPLPLDMLATSGVWAGLFGGVTAAGSLELARHASRALPPGRSSDRVHLEDSNAPGAINSGMSDNA